MDILHHEINDSGIFFILKDKQRIAELIYSKKAEKQLLIIEHTAVTAHWRGKKIGEALVTKVVELARAHHQKILPLCAFAALLYSVMLIIKRQKSSF